MSNQHIGRLLAVALGIGTSGCGGGGGANYNSMPFDLRVYEFCSDAGSPCMDD